jgi:hypothetical protein
MSPQISVRCGRIMTRFIVEHIFKAGQVGGSENPQGDTIGRNLVCPVLVIESRGPEPDELLDILDCFALGRSAICDGADFQFLNDLLHFLRDIATKSCHTEIKGCEPIRDPATDTRGDSHREDGPGRA